VDVLRKYIKETLKERICQVPDPQYQYDCDPPEEDVEDNHFDIPIGNLKRSNRVKKV